MKLKEQSPKGGVPVTFDTPPCRFKTLADSYRFLLMMMGMALSCKVTTFFHDLQQSFYSISIGALKQCYDFLLIVFNLFFCEFHILTKC